MSGDRLSQADIERLAQRDRYFQTIDIGLMFRQHAETGKVLAVLRGYLESGSTAAVERLASLSPLDSAAISDAQVTIRAYFLLRDTIASILGRAAAAEKTVVEMDSIGLTEEEDERY